MPEDEEEDFVEGLAVDIRQAARLMAKWLRHKPEQAGLELSPEGWAEADGIVAALAALGYETDLPGVIALARSDRSNRFEVEGARLRARYGHSIEVVSPQHAGTPPGTLFAAVPRRRVDQVLSTGLAPIKRQLVHLMVARSQAIQMGSRRGLAPGIVVVAAALAHAAGVKFYPRGSGIWLSDPIPPNYLTADARQATERPQKAATPGTPRRRRPPKGGFTKSKTWTPRS